MKLSICCFYDQRDKWNIYLSMVSVSIVREDGIIYISQDMFDLYEQALSEHDGIELRKG